MQQAAIIEAFSELTDPQQNKGLRAIGDWIEANPIRVD